MNKGLFIHLVVIVGILLSLNANAQNRQRDTIKVFILVSNTEFEKAPALGIRGYSVREKHNTDEGQIDPYAAYGYVSRDYWVHVLYLGRDKKELPKSYIVWGSFDFKW